MVLPIDLRKFHMVEQELSWCLYNEQGHLAVMDDHTQSLASKEFCVLQK
jgi:hypothetical protein